MKLKRLVESLRKLLQKSGIEVAISMDDPHSALLDEIYSVLDRTISIDALPSLIDALDGGANTFQVQNSAIGIDSSAFLRMANHARGEDLIDYFNTAHQAPIVLPGQVIQEFWNNEISAVDTIGKVLQGSFKKFKQDLDKLDQNFDNLKQTVTDNLDEFQNDHGHVYSEATVRKTLSLLNTLQNKAEVPFAPRTKFHSLASQRQMTKTPPGFKDDGDGDFYVWVDFLLGVKQAQVADKSFDRAILVTNDTKIDWGRSTSAHPILIAEAKALLGVPFVTWTLAEFATAALNVTG